MLPLKNKTIFAAIRAANFTINVGFHQVSTGHRISNIGGEVAVTPPVLNGCFWLSWPESCRPARHDIPVSQATYSTSVSCRRFAC